MLIRIENNQPVGNPIMDENLRLIYPNTSFPSPLSSSAVEAFGYAFYEQSPAPTVGTWQKAVETTPVKNAEGVWVQTWEVEPLTPEEREEKEGLMRGTNKRSAEQLLTQSDWAVLPDVDLANKADWASYRATLRGIARNPPIDPAVFPTRPPEVWND
jgi:hypothetical protein